MSTSLWFMCASVHCISRPCALVQKRSSSTSAPRSPARRPPGGASTACRCATVQPALLLVNRNYARLWAGQAVSLLGDFVFATTLVLWVSVVLLPGRSYAPAAVSAILFCAAVATLLVGPIAGVFVDRWDRRRTMLRADLIRAGLVGALTAVAFLPGDWIPVPVTLG